MKFVACLFLFFSINCSLLFAQESNPIPPTSFRTLNLSDQLFGIHLEPISWLFATDGRLRIGAVLQRRSISYLLDLEWGSGGLGGAPVSNDFEIVPGYRYRGIRPEIRIHWPRFWGTGYLGLEYAWSKSQREMKDGGYYDPNLSPGADILTYDFATREMERNSVLLKLGRNWPVFKRFYLDGYIGIGRTWQTVDFPQALNLRVDLNFHEGSRAADEGNIFNRYHRGRKKFVAFVIGARFGLRFEEKPQG